MKDRMTMIAVAVLAVLAVLQLSCGQISGQTGRYQLCSAETIIYCTDSLMDREATSPTKGLYKIDTETGEVFTLTTHLTKRVQGNVLEYDWKSLDLWKPGHQK